MLVHSFLGLAERKATVDSIKPPAECTKKYSAYGFSQTNLIDKWRSLHWVAEGVGLQGMVTRF